MNSIRTLIRAVLLVGCAWISGCATSTTKRDNLPPVRAVDQVELQRYLGTWYEIASYPQSFQRGCTATTATYSLIDEGRVRVVNRCRKGGLDGKEKVANGRARVVDATNAKLEVSFFRPFWGDYWIVDLDTDYQWAVVGHPSRDYLWILSRKPHLEGSVYDAILERLRDQHYDTTRLNVTEQP